MGIVEALSAGTATLSLAEKLVQLVEKAKEEDSPLSLREFMEDLQSEAVGMSEAFASEMRSLNAGLQRSGIDVDKSIPQLYDDLRWYNVRTRTRIKGYERRFLGLYERLAGFIDDIVSVLMCANEQQTLRQALQTSRELKQRLDEVVNSDQSLRDIIGVMLEVSEDLYDRLHGV